MASWVVKRALLVVGLGWGVSGGIAQQDPNRPVAAKPALSPAETTAKLKLPPGFRVELIAGEPEILQPIAFTIDDRGRLWVLENTNYPNSPGKPVDKIVVFEDANGDGTFEKRTVFWDKAPFSSGIAVGFGGVWVGSPPNLLFIPDRDGDAVPDGPPEIVLDGWAAEDTHETLNNFTWGPDGWLYGTHGIFTFSKVGKPGTPDAGRVAINAGVWRYHPTRKVFERWCEGGSNQWGIDWNDRGEAFFEACVIPHMWHAMEGAHYQRQAGSHDSPHVYSDIQTIAWGRYPKAGYCGAMLYLGGAFPAEWRDCFFFSDVHMNTVRCEKLIPEGSGFHSERKADFLVSPDEWFRGLSTQYGPDGGVFVSDWYDKVPCHQQRAFTDRTNGRIYKIVTDAVKPVRVDLTKATDAELVAYQLNPNDWYVRHARRLLQERGQNPQTVAALEKILFENPDETRQLRALWALHSMGALSAASGLKTLEAESEAVRGWAITALAESGQPANEVAVRFAEISQKDRSPVVRRRLASALQRLPLAQRWPALQGLAAHGEDATDRNLPLMVWYAAEPAVAADALQGVALLERSQLPVLEQFIARRVIALETPAKASPGLNALVQLLANAAPPRRQNILRGMLEGSKGREQLAEPAAWENAYARLKTDPDGSVRQHAQALALLFGSRSALEELRVSLSNNAAPEEGRRAAIESLALRRDAESLEPLLHLANEPGPLVINALRALASYDDARVAPMLLARFASFTPDERQQALNTFLSRPRYASALLEGIDSGKVARKELTAPLVRVLQGFNQPVFNLWLENNWGAVKVSSAEKQKEIKKYKEFLSADAILRADVKKGHEIFQRTCAVCHTLFGEGGKIGPELPGNFSDVDYLLQNVLDPNAIIGKDYQQTFVTTKAGQLYAGVVVADDGSAVTLKTLAGPVIVPRADIANRELSPMSMMPEGLLGSLSEPEVRDLFLYLRQQNGK